MGNDSQRGVSDHQLGGLAIVITSDSDRGVSRLNRFLQQDQTAGGYRHSPDY